MCVGAMLQRGADECAHGVCVCVCVYVVVLRQASWVPKIAASQQLRAWQQAAAALQQQ
jgi:hypothetical protein